MALPADPAPAEGQPDNDNTFSRLVEIDSKGDLKLIVGDDKVCFLVCSRALSRSARPWEAMLYGPFVEKKPADGQDWFVKLPEDDPAALHVVLVLVHGNSDKLPDVDLKLAFEVTILTNKYGMTRCLWPCAKDWLADLKPWQVEGTPPRFEAPPVQWLWLTQELGDLKGYTDAFQQLALQTDSDCKDPPTLTAENPPQDGGNASVAMWKDDTSEAGKVILADLAGEICRARLTAIEKIYSYVRDDLKDLKAAVERHLEAGSIGSGHATICSASSATVFSRSQCDIFMEGCASTIENHHYWCFEDRLENTQDSVDCLLGMARETLTGCQTNIARFQKSRRHTNCTPFKRGLPSLDDLRQLVNVTPPTKITYIQGQGRLSGVKRGVKDPRKRTHDEVDLTGYSD